MKTSAHILSIVGTEVHNRKIIFTYLVIPKGFIRSNDTVNAYVKSQRCLLQYDHYCPFMADEPKQRSFQMWGNIKIECKRNALKS